MLSDKFKSCPGVCFVHEDGSFFIPVELALAVVDVCFNSVSLVWNENYIVGIFKITSVWYNSECFFHYVD